MTLRVLGIDPGLTRCGIGIVDVSATRTATLVHVGVIATPPSLVLEQRLLAIARGIEEALDRFSPQAVGLERMFAQHNLRTVMGTAQASGVALQIAASRGLAVGLHTPSEVKAAITGYGSADKRQVGTMVAKVLGLAEIPRPADAADALAIALCHGWRGGAWGDASRRRDPSAGEAVLHRSRPEPDVLLTPAQQAWRAAERAAR
jgi:crossover junction endodeoxyribonuclease RuvC